MLKNAYEIAKTIDCHYSTVNRNIKKLELNPVEEKGHIKYYDQFQQILLIEHLTNNGVIDIEKLRSITEIAEICNTDHSSVSRIIRRENIKAIKINPLRFNESQQEIIFRFLYYEKKLEFITLPSKMNEDPIYSSRLDFLKNGNLLDTKKPLT